jgi:hypothetical protein
LYRSVLALRLAVSPVEANGWPRKAKGFAYDQTIRILKSAVQNAKLGREKDLVALKRLAVKAY